MARTLFALPLLACLVLGSGCGEARVATRNIEQVGLYLAEQGPDDVVRAAGRAIAIQADAVGDQQDLVLWGLLASRKTQPTVTKEDWAEAPKAAERRSEVQAYKVQAETARIQAISGSIFESLGLASTLTGSGLLGLAMAWALKNQGTIRELGTAFAKMRNAETEEEAKKIEDEYPVAKKAVAKAKSLGKV